jgi:FXSXX-COOH protein
MVTTEELRPASPVDLDEVPLTEILALGPDVLWGTIGRSLPGRTAGPVQVAAFQSAI